jgi:alkylation response protein AidB-like acyl-CoA dehydrogenase
MDYDFTNQEIAFFSDISEKIAPLAASLDLEKRGPATDAERQRRVLSLLSETPYMKLGHGAYGEMNGALTLMGAMEVLSAITPSAYLSAEASTRLFGRAVSEWGTELHKSRLLAPLLDGSLVGALALSEASMNIENQPLQTTGRKEGDTVSVSGKKQYVINAPIADWIAVAGVFADECAVFFVEGGSPGLTVQPPLETIGYEGVPIAGIVLENCRIPESQVIVPGAGKQTPRLLRRWEDQILLGASLGLSKAAFDTAKDFAKSHQSGGKPIIAYQEIGFKLAEMLTLLQTAQLLAYRSAWSLETGAGDAGEVLHCAKVFCTDAAEQIASEALRILGASGYTAGNPAERAYRCAKFGQIAGTSTEIARASIGDAALGYRN